MLERGHKAHGYLSSGEASKIPTGLSPIRLAIDLLQKQIDDTVVQVGAEAYSAARTVYAVTKTPYAGGILRTAAEDLGKRFGRKPRVAMVATPAAPLEPAPSAPAPAPGSLNA